MRGINVDINALPRVAQDLDDVVNSLYSLTNESRKILSTIKNVWDDEQFEAFSKVISANNIEIEKLCPGIIDVSGQIKQYYADLNTALNKFYR